jgi:4-hydroxy-3-methylbut-2-enyl diphosphate reductase
MRLLELAQSLTGRAYRLEGPEDLRPEWLQGVESVGITSAASTPEDLVQGLLQRLKALSPGLEVIEEGEWEEIAFREPKPLSPDEVLSQTAP